MQKEVSRGDRKWFAGAFAVILAALIIGCGGSAGLSTNGPTATVTASTTTTSGTTTTTTSTT